MSAIVAQTQTGPRTVEAEVIGPFAVHPALGYWPKCYTVAHIATGYAVTNTARTKKQARKLARELSKHDWWNFDKPEDAKAFSEERMRVIRPLVREAQA